MRLQAITISAILALCLGTHVHAELITNGDFSGGASGTWAPGANTGPDNSVPTGWTGYATANKSLSINTGTQQVAFNAGDTATGSWIQQTVTTTPNLWYMLSWDESNPGGAIPQRARTDVNVWDGNAPSGSGDLLSIRTRYPRTGRAQLFRATSDVTTLRFGDMGSNSTSNDGGLSSISLTPSALHGKVNIAPLFGTATASSTHGSFGIDPIFAIDNQSDFGVSHYTTYHSANNGSNAWWTLTYHEPVTLTEIEIQARTGFDDRNGDFLELYDSGGGLIDSLLIEDDSLWGVAGKWHDVASLTIRNSASNSVALNLGEVRTYAVFNNGMFVIPEPGTWTLFAMSLLAAR